MKYKENFLKYLVDNNLLNSNYLQIDLIPNGVYDNTLSGLEECLLFPGLEDFIYSGYEYEIRENRYYIILVDEFTKVKKDAQQYENRRND